jgi:hypothetical protein
MGPVSAAVVAQQMLLLDAAVTAAAGWLWQTTVIATIGGAAEAVSGRADGPGVRQARELPALLRELAAAAGALAGAEEQFFRLLGDVREAQGLENARVLPRTAGTPDFPVFGG